MGVKYGLAATIASNLPVKTHYRGRRNTGSRRQLDTNVIRFQFL